MPLARSWMMVVMKFTAPSSEEVIAMLHPPDPELRHPLAVRDGAIYGHELLITAFVFITAPISAHLLIKSALHVAGRDARSPNP